MCRCRKRPIKVSKEKDQWARWTRRSLNGSDGPNIRHAIKNPNGLNTLHIPSKLKLNTKTEVSIAQKQSNARHK